MMETTMTKFLAAFLALGLLVSAGATTASAAQTTRSHWSTLAGGNR
jgi:hypothetical protein